MVIGLCIAVFMLFHLLLGKEVDAIRFKLPFPRYMAEINKLNLTLAILSKYIACNNIIVVALKV